MSITFWAPAAPCITTIEDCAVCDGVGSSQWGTCGYCDGTGVSHNERSTLPEINMSNQNAHDFLRQFGEAESCGTWAVPRLKLLEPTLLLLSLGVNAASYERETEVQGNFINCGRDTVYVTRKARDMLTFVRAAIAGNYEVSWG